MGTPDLSLLGKIVAPGGPTSIARAAERLRDALGELGADVGYIGRLGSGGRAVHVLRVTNGSPNLVELAFPLDAPYPIAAAIRLGVPFFISDNAHLACDHPGLVRVRTEDHACATVPLFDGDGELLGAINVTFEDPHDLTERERVLIESAAVECATELQR